VNETYERPNILIFLADDAGWRDSGIYGNPYIRTPGIDELSRNGLTFERAFLTTPQCSPSRISILTGKYPHATGAEDLHMPLPDDETILPKHLQEAGYFTGHMRKTHYGPNGEAQFEWYSDELSKTFPEFLDAREKRPFFLWVGFSDPHRPYAEDIIPSPHAPDSVFVPPYLADTPETRADLALYYDEISRMDAQIGRFISELERRNLRNNTLIIFLSDNGQPFPRAKGTLYDAGMRTPLIFSWPEQIEAGESFEGLASVIDLAPTILELADQTPPEEMQGESILPALLNPGRTEGREYVFSERNWHDADEHMRSIRTERFKLIRNAYTEHPHGTPADIGNSPAWFSLLERKERGDLTHAQSRLFEVPRPVIELYDLEIDPWELHNLAGTPEHRDTAMRLARQLEEWIEETGDFPPTERRRADHTDRVTGMRFRFDIPPLQNAD
jgi:arylsulfatase A-like enzyme